MTVTCVCPTLKVFILCVVVDVPSFLGFYFICFCFALRRCKPEREGTTRRSREGCIVGPLDLRLLTRCISSAYSHARALLHLWRRRRRWDALSAPSINTTGYDRARACQIVYYAYAHTRVGCIICVVLMTSQRIRSHGTPPPLATTLNATYRWRFVTRALFVGLISF